MPLALPDKWVWDFWLAQDGSDYHIFYLQAPKSLKDEGLRHWNVSIGHAVSQDLCRWEILPDALAPSSEASWDDYTTWTGSIIQHQGRWHLFYTGSSRAEKGLVQRIGTAVSDDLLHWQKHPAPLIEADPRWYELLDLDKWHDQSWRDPYLFQHPETELFHALITGRANHGPADGRGVIAHAQSADLVSWEVLPPLTESGEFGVLEVPQLVAINGRYYLIFCAWSAVQSAQRTERLGRPSVTGTHYLVADNPLGPFHYSTDTFFAGDTHGSLYSGKVVTLPNGEHGFMAFQNYDAAGNFVGEIIDPLPIQINTQGHLQLANAR